MAQVAHDFKEKNRTSDVLISENIDFNGLLLSEPVLKGLQDAGFVRPSPIQLKAIPLGRCGLDLIVQAKSGTGKTCVFSVIGLESITTDTNSTQVLVLAPTREIAVQIWEVINSIGRAIYGLECHTFIGGLPLPEDRMKLRKCHIAVGSPGRIKQLIECGGLKTDSIRLFVLDEADKLLEESFQEQINWIYSMLPDNKQMLALSATYPEYLATHLKAYMRNPTYLRLNITDPTLLGIRQYFQTVPYHPMAQAVFEHKSKALVNILSAVSFQQCLVFSNLQTRAQTLADSLISQGWPTACIAGCLDQKDRNEAMAKLKTYKCRILISTDLTSRGIDADKVSLVINLDVPKDHETYLHRIGRAGRFGAFGIGITLVSEGTEKLNLDAIEKRCNTHIFPLPDPLPSDLARAEAPVCLDDVVSTELINTDTSHNSMKFNLLNNANEHSDQDVGGLEDPDEVMKSIEANKIKNSTNGQHEYPTECGDNVCDIEGDINVTATLVHSSGSQNVKEADLTAEKHGLKVVENPAGQTCVGEFDVESIDNTGNFTASSNHMSETAVTDSAVEEIEQLKELSLESGDEATQGKYQEDLRSSDDKVKHADEKVHVVFRGDDLRTKAMSVLEDINLSEQFRQSVGYKPLANPHTYSTCCNALGTFRKGYGASVSTYGTKQLMENIKTGLDKCVDSQRLQDVAVSLEELFDNHIDIVHDKDAENADFMGEIRPDIGQNGIGFKASEVETINEKDLGVNVKTFSQQHDYSKGASSSFVNEYDLLTKNKTIGVGQSFQKEEKRFSVLRNETVTSIKKTRDQDNKPNEKPKKHSRIGYQGKFSIGHLLEVERQKDSQEIEVTDTMEMAHSENSIKSFGSDTVEKIEENYSQRKTCNTQEQQQSYRSDINEVRSRSTDSFNQIRNSYSEKDHRVEENGSLSDMTESEHSDSEYTEDSDTDSTSSDNLTESRSTQQYRKQGLSNSVRHRQMTKHSAREVSRSMNDSRHKTVPEYDTNSQSSQMHAGFNAHYRQQQQPCHWPSYYYPDYWLPWQHYNGYQGYPGYQYSYPYHYNPSPYTPGRSQSYMSMDKVQQMQQEYIKAMCKRDG